MDPTPEFVVMRTRYLRGIPVMSWDNEASPNGASTPPGSDHLRYLGTKGAVGIMPSSCSAADCDRPVKCRDLCSMHYARLLRDIPLNQPQRIIGDLESRFWAKVDGGDYQDCWLWTASLNDGGYGQFAIDGRPHRAHRVAYELLRTEIPEGLQLDHLCRVRACVNPWHVEPVTNEVNTARGNFRAPREPVKFCKHGHEFTPENTYVEPRGYRRCRACERRNNLAAYYRRKAAS